MVTNEMKELLNLCDKLYEKIDEYLENEDREDSDDNDKENHLSAENGDYSPSCPWNAPGMSVKDFV